MHHNITNRGVDVDAFKLEIDLNTDCAFNHHSQHHTYTLNDGTFLITANGSCEVEYFTVNEFQGLNYQGSCSIASDGGLLTGTIEFNGSMRCYGNQKQDEQLKNIRSRIMEKIIEKIESL